MNDKKTAPKKISKKETREIVYGKLAAALVEYKSVVKEKRFETNLKKAAKLFSDDIAKAANKANQKSGKPGKKPGKSKKIQAPEQPAAS